MKVTAERIPGSQVLLKIEIPPEKVEQAITKTYRDVSRRVRVPGFRPGRAPRALIERYVGGPEVIQQEGIDRLIDDSYREALKEADVHPIGEPDLNERPEFHPGEPLVIEASVPVTPTVELGDYQSIRLQPVAVEATPQQVNEFVDSLVGSHAEWQPVQRSVQNGDHVVIDVTGIVGSVPTLFGPSGEPLLTTPGGREVYNVKDHEHLVDTQNPPEFAPGFDEEMIGLIAGSEKTFGLTLPADFPDAELANQSIVFTIKLHEVKEKHLPELNDEFAKQVQGGDTVEELRENIRREIQNRMETETRALYEDALVEAAVSRSTIDIPSMMVERQIDSQIEDLKADLARQKLAWADYLNLSHLTEEKIREQMQPQAERTVKSYLVMREIAKHENLEVDPEEVNAAINLTAAQFGSARNAIRERLSTRDQRERIEGRLFYRKVIDRLDQIAQQPPLETEEPVSEIGVAEQASTSANPPEENPAAEQSTSEALPNAEPATVETVTTSSPSEAGESPAR
ncbi:MAG TPA: trigger factor [Chloroflexota bacterium]|nr:trigger factor [Chloroflexota bacterium]